jgi:Cys-rich repeat protein
MRSVVGLVTGLVLLVAGVARADEPQQCKADADCGTGGVCKIDGKCFVPPSATPPPTTPPPTPPGPSDADKQKAGVHSDSAEKLFDKGNWAAALAEWQAAYKLDPQLDTLFNIGSAHQKLFQYVEAAEAFEKYISLSPPETDTSKAKQVVADLQLLIVELKVTVTPAKDVIVRVDGKELGKLPLAKPLRISSGTRVFELVLEGYEPFKETRTVTSGAPVELKADLKFIPKTGKVRINSPVPRATVSIDGQPRGPAPIEVELSGGGHQIEVSAPDYQTHRGDLNVTAGQTRDVNISLDKVIVAKAGKPWYKKWYIVAPVSAVVVGGGIGTYLFVTATPDPITGTLSPGAGKIQ